MSIIKVQCKYQLIGPILFLFPVPTSDKASLVPDKASQFKTSFAKRERTCIRTAFFLESTDPILETQSHCKTPQELCIDTGIAQQELLGLFHHSIFSLVENAREDAIGYCKIQTVLFAISQPSDTIYNLKLKNCSKDSIAKRKIID